MSRQPAALAAAVSDPGVPERYHESQSPAVDTATLERGLADALEQVEANLDPFYDRFPTASSDDLLYLRPTIWVAGRRVFGPASAGSPPT